MSLLLSPIKIRSLELRNRLLVSPMCQYSSEDGFANEWHLVHLGARAVGGAGLVFTEATAVSPEGRISIDDLGIWKDEHIPMLTTIAGFIARQGAVPGIQLAHAGRKASIRSPWKGDSLIPVSEGGWPTVAPSALPYSDRLSLPRALDDAGIEKVRNDFKAAARRALEAGFQVAEIHAAHGYLLHEFLSPLSNHRTDKYGGSREHRMRLLLEVTSDLRAIWPSELPLFVRISTTDWREDGWNIGDSVALAAKLKELGVDVLDCSTAGILPGITIPLAPGYQVPFAERIRKEAGISTTAVGLITTPTQAEEILQQGRADLVVLARQFLRDPYFPIHAASELGDEIKWPDQYLRARPKK
jgi:2,4-dienoyl-CoA reductase-like NADH-dependent reductase (Old Yellow Enzyme family)